eukprot:Seg2218.3 transcript_id=Seg2218.3/GoldUCD/mRNA.D3Y31 product="hypothetical protein" protein_id=Seg2218.3/GoldUCD/D3Y31
MAGNLQAVTRDGLPCVVVDMQVDAITTTKKIFHKSLYTLYSAKRGEILQSKKCGQKCETSWISLQ